MVITHQAVSGYRLKMEQALRDEQGRGVTVISQEALTAMLGSKVTPAFRRHIAAIQADGYVTRFTYRSEAGGWKVAYSIHFPQES